VILLNEMLLFFLFGFHSKKVYKLRDVAKELRSLLDSRNDNLGHLQMKTEEVTRFQLPFALPPPSTSVECARSPQPEIPHQRSVIQTVRLVVFLNRRLGFPFGQR